MAGYIVTPEGRKLHPFFTSVTARIYADRVDFEVAEAYRTRWTGPAVHFCPASLRVDPVDLLHGPLTPVVTGFRLHLEPGAPVHRLIWLGERTDYLTVLGPERLSSPTHPLQRARGWVTARPGQATLVLEWPGPG